MNKLRSIVSRGGEDHVILIDDARCFTGFNDFPTLLDLEGFVRSWRPGWAFYVEDDIINIHRQSSPTG